MNGPWYAENFFGSAFFTCPSLTFIQTGMSLSFSGTCGIIDAISVTGSIDPVTGQFSGSGTGGTECPSITFTIAFANLDNRTFFAGFVCTGGPMGGFQGALNGRRCGNGAVDAITGEDCDTALGQCCAAPNCEFTPAGALCSDGNQCTDDMCDGAGTCESANRTGSCDDGNECTSPDECIAGACTSTVLPDNSPCEDFNDCTTQSCQAGSCQIVNQPNGTPCDDFLVCTGGETCLSGACQTGNPVVCPACTVCYESEGCVPEDNMGHSYLYGVEDSLKLKKTSTDLAKWKWLALDPVAPDGFGDPLTATDYEFCVFDLNNLDPVTFAPRLLYSAPLPAGSSWTQTGSGFRFENADKLKVTLKSGPAGRAKIRVIGKGIVHPVQFLPPLEVPVEVQLRTAEGVLPQRAYYAVYYNPVTSTEKRYKAQNPEP